ncbi:GUN4 domain-containing protein [Alkalinema sp. FACHB-956]|uniref:GUN4 domain-containing protein n=1 Tax=Alkalinema sp. FACHB-956 TaxID=2692768 RepID=UPI0016864E8C|nr:GUN4 domain-containing protein [Alkalinema sp. FACHB-956]MBD2326032.1 GUN4 N-terminal ARM-like repeat domain-containing protein [Alkalinema sp. FACHB-956]
MTNLDTSSVSSPLPSDLRAQFLSATERNRLPIVDQLAALGQPGYEVLMDFLREYQASEQVFTKYGAVNTVAAKAYQALFKAQTEAAQAFLSQHFPTGIVPLKSDRAIDYLPLQQLLAQQDFLEADKLTSQKLCELAGGDAIQRKWVYFTEVNAFPTTDLRTINALWLAHSEGKFGYSVQRELWLSVGKNWEKLWAKIGWKDGINWTRYPGQFVWTIEAPKGHLPLSNQLRGVRVIDGLLSHPAWES